MKTPNLHLHLTTNHHGSQAKRIEALKRNTRAERAVLQRGGNSLAEYLFWLQRRNFPFQLLRLLCLLLLRLPRQQLQSIVLLRLQKDQIRFISAGCRQKTNSATSTCLLKMTPKNKAEDKSFKLHVEKRLWNENFTFRSSRTFGHLKYTVTWL